MSGNGSGMEHDGDAREQAVARQIGAVEAEALRLAARVRQMAAGNRALRASNQTLNDTNTGLRRDIAEARAATAAAQGGRADAQADTAEARAATVDAQAATAKVITRNEDLQATNDVMDTRNEALQATNDVMDTRNEALQATNDVMDTRNEALQASVDEVERANTALRAHRLEGQKLAAVLEAERAQLAVILAGIEDAVVVVDQAGATVRANAAYVQLFGDDVGTALYDAQGHPLGPDQTPRARAARGETFSLSCSLATGIPSLVGEDTRRWFEAKGQPLPEPGATHAIVVMHDSTLSAQHRRLQEEFLALAGHELRTPLTSIQGFLDLLVPLLGAESDVRARRYATRALHQTRRLVALVRDLTDVARLQSGKLTLDEAAVDLTALVEQVVETAQALPPEPAIYLEAGATPVWVRGDAGRLEQILFNLLTNARTHAPSARPITVRLRRVGAEVVLEVQDYGGGIAADQLPYLFVRFYQVARADRPAHGGLGLGLYLCQELIRAHGGRIAVTSTVGEGTTFTVWLPLLAGESGATPPPHYTEARPHLL